MLYQVDWSRSYNWLEKGVWFYYGFLLVLCVLQACVRGIWVFFFFLPLSGGLAPAHSHLLTSDIGIFVFCRRPSLLGCSLKPPTQSPWQHTRRRETEHAAKLKSSPRPEQVRVWFYQGYHVKHRICAIYLQWILRYYFQGLKLITSVSLIQEGTMITWLKCLVRFSGMLHVLYVISDAQTVTNFCWS